MQVIELEWLMNSFRKTRVYFLGGTILGHVWELSFGGEGFGGIRLHFEIFDIFFFFSKNDINDQIILQ